ncbi:MAG: serine hydrolase [Candidatus Competibacteraceae bacterium]|nr:serine hydrolase [Candidatus Competibacteraceae bacterium]
MPSNAPVQPAATAAEPVIDPSRRTFLTGLGALFMTAAFDVRDALAQWNGGSSPFPEPDDYNPPRRYDYPGGYGRPRGYDYPRGYNRAPGYNPPGWENRNWPARPLDDAPTATRTMLDLNPVIQRYISQQRAIGRLAANERSAWLVQDFTTNRYLATLNADIAYQSASMIKPFIALAFFYKVQEGKLEYSAPQRRRMEAMIQYSNNHATNYFIELLNRTSGRNGPAEVEHTLKLRHPGLFRHTQVLENIPRGGRSYRNRASALDYSRFLQALWFNQLPYATELKRLMSLPNRDRIYTGATNVSKGTWVFDKTGTTARLCGDMGILVAKGRDGRRYPYTFIGIIEKATSASNYTSWKNSRGNVIREVSSLVYTHMQRMHNLV